MKNKEIADHLLLISKLKEINGENKFACSAFQHAAYKISNMSEDVSAIDVTTISGIGKTISAVIKQYLTSNTSDAYDTLSALYPADALTMTVVDGIGPKRALALYHKGHKNYSELLAAAKDGKLDAKLTKAVLFSEIKAEGRIPYDVALKTANDIRSQLLSIDGVINAEIAGSIRRKMASSKDIDIAISISDSVGVRDNLLDKYKGMGTNFIGGAMKASIKVMVSLTGDGRQVVGIQSDIWIGSPENWGALLNHCTGSKDHNIRMRAMAKSFGYQINEYGIFDSSGKKLGGEKETDMFDVLGIEYIKPEDRK